MFIQEPAFHLESHYTLDRDLPRNVGETAQHIVERVHDMHTEIAEKIQQAKLDWKIRYDARVRSVRFKFRDLVFLYKVWCGPLRIIKVYSDMHAQLYQIMWS